MRRFHRLCGAFAAAAVLLASLGMKGATGYEPPSCYQLAWPYPLDSVTARLPSALELRDSAETGFGWHRRDPLVLLTDRPTPPSAVRVAIWSHVGRDSVSVEFYPDFGLPKYLLTFALREPTQLSVLRYYGTVFLDDTSRTRVSHTLLALWPVGVTRVACK
jgi:hypothetical protein